jgi:hypothetical protein
MFSGNSDTCVEAFPSKDLLAKRSGLSKRSVDRAIAQAATDGWVEISQLQRKSGGGFYNRYLACIPDRLAFEVDRTRQQQPAKAPREAW